ncbi:MAG: hypothetical protein GX619_01655 [Bacteroidales bacterium]|jgi:hypothetical protein|nr:hypothetical protein [Bacteroidales bacterium]
MRRTQILVLCVCVWVLGVCTVKGQEINYVDFYDYLDTTRISTGVLYNKVIPYSSFMEYWHKRYGGFQQRELVSVVL